jgi:predicted NBD/HSP70 family sugar kinase
MRYRRNRLIVVVSRYDRCMAEIIRTPRTDALVLDVLGRHGELDRTALGQLTGLARSTVTDVLVRLGRQEVIVQRPGTGGRVGRPAGVVALACPPGVIGVLALTNGVLQAAAVGFDGTIHASRSVKTVLYELTDGLVRPGTDLLEAAMSEGDVPREQLRCAVVCVPLPLSTRGGVPHPDRMPPPQLTTRMHQLPQWLLTDPARALGEQLGVPAWAENDANLAALGEAAFGAGRGTDDLIYLKVVVGIGAGLILGGRLHRGAGGLAGELAHLHIKEDGPVCVCGGRGCLMTQFNSPRLVDLVQSAHPQTLTLEDVLALAESRDPGVLRVLGDLGRLLGRSLADACVYLNPSQIIVDGLLGGAADPVIDGIREMVQRYLQPLAATGLTVVRGHLGANAEILGAVTLARLNYRTPTHATT